LFYNFYERFILKPKCFLSVDYSKEFENIPHLICPTKRQSSSEYFEGEDIKTIKNANLDFIILFSGFENIKGEILYSTRFGIWSYHHGDPEKFRGNPHCFWEIYYDNSVTGVILQKLTANISESVILRRGFFKTHNNSFTKNLDNVHNQSSRWIKEVCIDLLNNDAEYLNSLPTKYESSIYNKPTNIQFIRFYLKLLKNKISKFLRRVLFIEQWNIGYIDSPINKLLESNRNSKITWPLSPKKNEFFADPFPIKVNNNILVLFEKYRVMSSILCEIQQGHSFEDR